MDSIERVKLSGDDTGIRVTKYRHTGYHTHWHNFYEFEITVNGNGTQSINNTDYTNTRGDMVLIRLTDFHRIDTAAEVYRIQIPISCMPEDVDRILSVTTSNLYAHASEEELERISALCDLLMLTTEESEYDKDYAELLLSVIIRTFIKLMAPSVAKCASNSRLVAVCRYIQEHFAEDITLDAIAAHFGFNKNYFCAFFKTHTSMTLTEFIKELRLQYAARLVGVTDYSSLQISEMSGYNSHSNYLRDFKKRFGISPIQMRKRK